MKKINLFLIAVLSIGLAFNACSKKTAAVQTDNRETITPSPAQPLPQPASTRPVKPAVKQPVPASEPVQADKTDKEQGITITTAIEDKILQFDAINFDYDSYELRPDAIATLEKIAGVLKENPTATITIEGHCDERGTVEYNLALGEQRAHSVKTYFVEYGLNPDNLSTISYGKEKPIDPHHNEAAWSKNRRAVLNHNETE